MGPHKNANLPRSYANVVLSDESALSFSTPLWRGREREREYISLGCYNQGRARNVSGRESPYDVTGWVRGVSVPLSYPERGQEGTGELSSEDKEVTSTAKECRIATLDLIP